MSLEVVSMTQRKSDHEIASDLRDRMRAKLSEICMLMDEANKNGMRIEFALGPDVFSRCSVQRLDITKPLI